MWRDYGTIERLKVVLWVPVIRVAGDVAKMIGYPVGLCWRWRHRPPDWRRSSFREGRAQGVDHPGQLRRDFVSQLFHREK
jgi:hypothetical protein